MRFVYSLAEHLHKTVAELAASMSTVELAGWKAYFTVKERERKFDEAAGIA